MNTDWFEQQASMLEEILQLLRCCASKLERMDAPAPKDWYTPVEIARLIGRKPATVCGWCRDGRIAARKRSQGRGDKLEWEISREELQRFRDHGLLPRKRNHARQFTTAYRT